MRTTLLALAVAVSLAAASFDDTVVRPGTPWYDTKGKRIEAHGGGFLWDKSTATYYWYGESFKYDGGDLSAGVNVYSSKDLASWTYGGLAFANTSITGVGNQGPFRIERPKVIYCEKTSRYVLWFHLDTESFALQMVGVATSKTPTGPFVWHAGFKPDNEPSYDMTLYQEPDGRAYLVRSVRNEYTGFSRLSNDYLATTGIISKGPRVEGQAVWHDDEAGLYYLLGSHLTGWSPNPAILAVSSSKTIEGAEWSVLGDPAHDATTFNSQPTYVLPVQHASGKTLLMYCGDRWNFKGPGSIQNATYVWLPMDRDSEDGPALLVVQECSEGEAKQQWAFEADGTIRNQGLCMDIPDCNDGNSAAVATYACHPEDTTKCQQSRNQKWKLKDDGTIRSQMNDKCLDVVSFSGPDVKMYDCNGGTNQKWVKHSDGTVRNEKLCLTAATVPYGLTWYDSWRIGDF